MKRIRLKPIISCLLFISACYCVQLEAQENSLLKALNDVRESDTIYLITNSQLISELNDLNNGSIDLNTKIFEADRNNSTFEKIEELQKYKNYLLLRFGFLESFCSRFQIKNTALKNTLNTTKNSIELITQNTETLIDNFYKKNATVQVADMLTKSLMQLIKTQYPYLAGLLDLVTKYYENRK